MAPRARISDIEPRRLRFGDSYESPELVRRDILDIIEHAAYGSTSRVPPFMRIWRGDGTSYELPPATSVTIADDGGEGHIISPVELDMFEANLLDALGDDHYDYGPPTQLRHQGPRYPSVRMRVLARCWVTGEMVPVATRAALLAAARLVCSGGLDVSYGHGTQITSILEGLQVARQIAEVARFMPPPGGWPANMLPGDPAVTDRYEPALHDTAMLTREQDEQEYRLRRGGRIHPPRAAGEPTMEQVARAHRRLRRQEQQERPAAAPDKLSDDPVTAQGIRDQIDRALAQVDAASPPGDAGVVAGYSPAHGDALARSWEDELRTDSEDLRRRFPLPPEEREPRRAALAAHESDWGWLGGAERPAGSDER